MIMSTGNVGNYLAVNNPQQVNTYFTRDGGLTWDELMKGSTIYEYGDFGGLLVLASNVAPTSTFYYSLNGGITFSTVELPQVVTINNIVISSTQNERFIVIATIPGTRIWSYWGIDFSNIHERNCTDADYETWEPHDGVRGPKCVLGHDITYRRKMRNATCFTEDGLNQVVSQVNCSCDIGDYECDYDFERTVQTGKCSYLGTNIDEESEESQCVDGTTTYSISSGYRKLPGDTCQGDISEYAPTISNCTSAAINNNNQVIARASPSAIVIIIVCVAILVVGVGIGFCIGLRNERFRSKFQWIKAPSWVNIGYSNQLIEVTNDDEDGEGNKPDTELDQVPNKSEETEKGVDLDDDDSEDM